MNDEEREVERLGEVVEELEAENKTLKELNFELDVENRKLERRMEWITR